MSKSPISLKDLMSCPQINPKKMMTPSESEARRLNDHLLKLQSEGKFPITAMRFKPCALPEPDL